MSHHSPYEDLLSFDDHLAADARKAKEGREDNYLRRLAEEELRRLYVKIHLELKNRAGRQD